MDGARLYLFVEKLDIPTISLFVLLLCLILLFFSLFISTLLFLQECGFSIIGSILAFIEFAVLIVLVIISFNLISHNKKFQKHNKKLQKHDKKIKELQREHDQSAKLPFARRRIFLVVVSTILSSALGWLIYGNPLKWEIFNKITADTPSIISITTLVITAPIAFIIWIFRDKNKLLELENARKDTNLKEFQQLQRWATGNIEGDKDNKDNKIALQISALHSLRAYLKGEYGESFRRGAYEIFRASLATQHQKILAKVKVKDLTTAIDGCPLTKQLNIIASEEWFNLLINHNFPTNNISLLGVDLHQKYLHHRTYGKTLDLQSAQLQGASLEKAQLQGADLQWAQLQGADLCGAQLQEANLQSAQLQGAYLKRAKLQGADLSGAKLQGADLLMAQLQGANLCVAKLQGADLRLAQLQGAYLWAAELQGTDLRSAGLQGAKLCGAQLQRADLEGVQLQGVDAIQNSGQPDFERSINQRVGEITDSKKLENQCKELTEDKQTELIDTLKAIGTITANKKIRDIESASETLDLSEAITGTYTQEEADKWIKDYKDATNNVF